MASLENNSLILVCTVYQPHKFWVKGLHSKAVTVTQKRFGRYVTSQCKSSFVKVHEKYMNDQQTVIRLIIRFSL